MPTQDNELQKNFDALVIRSRERALRDVIGRLQEIIDHLEQDMVRQKAEGQHDHIMLHHYHEPVDIIGSVLISILMEFKVNTNNLDKALQQVRAVLDSEADRENPCKDPDCEVHGKNGIMERVMKSDKPHEVIQKTIAVWEKRDGG